MGGLAGYTPKQVEEVKMVLRLLPVFCATVLYWWVFRGKGIIHPTLTMGVVMSTLLNSPFQIDLSGIQSFLLHVIREPVFGFLK